MSKKKILLVGTTAITAVGVLLGVMFANKSSESVKTLGTGDEVWNHYNAVAPTLDKKGIKEYWVSCETHETVFAEPASENIVDKGAPTESFINSLANDDPRLVQRSWKAISFATASDADLIFSVRNNFSTKEIVDDSNAPDHDGKALKLMYKDGTVDFMLNEAYLDQAFGDSSVVALNFNMKATLEKDISYRQQNSTIRYEGNGANNFGLNTTWKTFAYPRSAYEAFKSDPNKSTINRNTFLWLGLSSAYESFELYLDNFHPVKKTLDWTGFERGRYNSGAAYLSWREGAVGSSGNEVFYVMDGNSTNPVTWSFDESIKTEGGRSIKITRAASDGLRFGFNSTNVSLATLLPESTSILSFDFRSSSKLNCNASISSIKICGSTPLSSGTNFQIPANTWVRIAIPKSLIIDNNIFTFHGGAAMDIWVDNIQFNTDLGCFEDETVIQANIDSWSHNGEYVNADARTNIDYAKVRTLRVLGKDKNVAHVGISTSRKTEGNSSLWVEVVGSSQEIAFYLSNHAKTWLTNNAGSTISLDIFRTSKGNLTFVNGNRSALEVPDSFDWCHYELTADDLTTDGRAIIIQGSNAVGDWYFDNICYNLA